MKKTWLMCPYKVAVGCVQLRVQVTQDPQEAVFDVWTQAMVVKTPPTYRERFATSLELFGLLVVETSSFL